MKKTDYTFYMPISTSEVAVAMSYEDITEGMSIGSKFKVVRGKVTSLFSRHSAVADPVKRAMAEQASDIEPIYDLSGKEFDKLFPNDPELLQDMRMAQDDFHKISAYLAPNPNKTSSASERSRIMSSPDYVSPPQLTSSLAKTLLENQNELDRRSRSARCRAFERKMGTLAATNE